MEIRFVVSKEERKALVKAVGEITGCEPVYQGTPSFAFAVGNYIIDRCGTLIYDEQMCAEDVRQLLTELSVRGFTYEGAHELDASVPEHEASTLCDGSDTEIIANKTIIIDMPLFNDTALDNLRKLIGGKAALIKKAIGADDLTVAVIGDALHFNWFHHDSTEAELEAYKQFVSALCLTAKKQKRVTMKESAVDSEKFAFRCFLLRLGFIGPEYASARKILLTKLSGSGSFKSESSKSRMTHSDCCAEESPEAITGDEGAYAMAEALADTELIHQVNMLLETDNNADADIEEAAYE